MNTINPIYTEYVAHAIYTVGRGPSLHEEQLGDGELSSAVWESFMVNIRLLGDFFFRGRAGDHRATDYGWDPALAGETASGNRLKGKWWNLASKEAMHLSGQRNPDDTTGGLSTIEDGWMTEASRDALEVVGYFVADLERGGAYTHEAGKFRLALSAGERFLTKTASRSGNDRISAP